MIDNKDNKDKKRRYLLEGKVVSIDKKKYSYRIDPDVIAEIEAMSKGKHKQGVFSEQVLKAALHYVEVGLFVIPIEKNAKKPVKEFTSKVAVAESGNLNMNSYTHFSTRDPEKVKEWFGEDGVYSDGYNLGIACGGKDGVFVVDGDKKNNGLENLANLHKQFGWEVGLIASTPSGGVHEYYLWQEGCGQSTGGKDSGIAEGIDTRGGDADLLKGHVVVYPSKLNNKRYTWKNFGAIPSAPAQVIRMLGKTYTPVSDNPPIGQTNKGRGNENVTDDDLEGFTNYESIPKTRRLLGFVPSSGLSYDKWVDTLRIIHRTHGDEGYQLAEEWSEQDNRFKPNDVRSRWDKLDDSARADEEEREDKDGNKVTVKKKVGMGSLVFMAKARGWYAGTECFAPDDPWRVLGEINERYPLLQMGGKVIHLIIEDNGGINSMAVGACTEWFIEQTIVMQVDNGKGGTKESKVNPYEMWRRWKGKRKYLGVGFYPPPQKCPKGHMNLWRGFDFDPLEGDVQIYLDFIFDVVCSGRKDVYEWVLDWIASFIQNPGQKDGTGFVTQGKKGTGKGVFAWFIRQILPQGTSKEFVNTEQFLGKFNAFMANNLFTYINEAMWSGHPQQMQVLKGRITDVHTMLELKGIDAVEVMNFSHYLMGTNSTWAFPASDDERRATIVTLSDVRRKDTAYFGSLVTWGEQMRNRQALLYFFMERRITNNLREGFETDELMEQKAITKEKGMTIADKILLELLLEDRAVQVKGGDYDGQWVWAHFDIRDIGGRIAGFKYSNQTPTALKRILKGHGLELETKDVIGIRKCIFLPSSPSSLVKIVRSIYNVPEDELPDATEWRELR